LKNGYSKEYAERIFRQLEGFGSYGFPESHAVSFAHLVYISAWIKCYYPDVFTCGLLNSLPMGFYAPAQIITDAKKHDVQTKPVDINHSFWDNTLEVADPAYCGEKINKYHALRIGFRHIKGICKEDIELLVSSRKEKYASINEILDAGVSINTLELLADADAFRSICLDRCEALWEITSLSDSPIGLFKGQSSESINEDKTQLPKMLESEHVVYDFASTSFSLKAHPLSFIREKLKALHVITLQELKNCQNGDIVRIAGNPFVKQRPGTAKGVCFISLEDEFTIANLVVFPDKFFDHRKEILPAQVLMAVGKVQIEDNVMHVIVEHCENWSGLLKGLTQTNNENISIVAHSPRDENDGFPLPSQIKVTQKRKKVIQEELFSDSRDFK
jgi:error-prone DNA polymerase